MMYFSLVVVADAAANVQARHTRSQLFVAIVCDSFEGRQEFFGIALRRVRPWCSTGGWYPRVGRGCPATD